MSQPVHPACLPIDQLLRECRLERTRRSGPGGQRRNKVETAVVLVHGPTGIGAQASERREAEQNRRQAVARLRLALALGVRLPRGDAGCSALWRSRVGAGRINVSEHHEDFPALLAEALDELQAAGFDLPAAARRLSCTPSQLVRFLKKLPEALAWLNRQRAQHGLRKLR